MATITGTIKDTFGVGRGNVKIDFIPQDTVFILSTATITSTTKTALTDSAGAFSLSSLVQGTYEVRIYKPGNDGAYDTVTIVVPAGSATYDISTLITSTPTTVGYFSSVASYDRADSPLNGEYIGGRHRWNVLAVLKAASFICNYGPTGSSFIVTLEVGGTLNTDYTMTLAAGAVTQELDLGNVQVTAGTYVRWKVTTAPGNPTDCPAQVSISMNVTT